MKKLYKRIKKRISEWFFSRQLAKAVDQAITLHNRDKKTYYVLHWNNRLLVVSTADLKRWQHSGYIRQGISLADIRRKALYKTK